MCSYRNKIDDLVDRTRKMSCKSLNVVENKKISSSSLLHSGNSNLLLGSNMDILSNNGYAVEEAKEADEEDSLYRCLVANDEEV